MRLRVGLGVLTAAFILASSAACSSTCLKKDDRIVVVVTASPNVNAGNGTPQPVQFRVWGVRDKGVFDGIEPGKLVEGDIGSLERMGFGRAFADGPAPWIRPGGSLEAVQKAAEEGQFTHVAIAVRFPQAKVESLALDCNARTGYTLTRPEHRAAFTLDGESIRVGGGEPAAR